jgi:gluconate 2-dehydrogenase subunit 3-like protein
VSLADRRELLATVLDVLIPADAGFPGAGAIALDHVLSTAAASSETEALLARALRAISEATADFSALGVDEREALLRETERTLPDAFDALVRLTYAGYYSHSEIVTRLGLAPGPLHPRGHRIADAELPDLIRVTSRGPQYRQA